MVVGYDSGVEEEEKEEEMHGRLSCPRWSRVHEAAAERTVRMLFDSMTNQARLIDQTYLPRHKAATTGTNVTLFMNCSFAIKRSARDQSYSAFNRMQIT